MKTTLILAFFLTTLMSSFSYADDATKSSGKWEQKEMTTMSKEQREQMAKVHEQMAVCLRSTKSLKECREEMRKTCMNTMGEQGCPMMSGRHWMMRNMHEEKE